MEESYIAKRITQLRMARNISEYQMSLELGHSKSYIQSITSGKSKPSTQELFNIADYFNMSLSEFFDEENVESPTVQKAIDAIRKLSEQDAALALAMIQRHFPSSAGGWSGAVSRLSIKVPEGYAMRRMPLGHFFIGRACGRSVDWLFT